MPKITKAISLIESNSEKILAEYDNVSAAARQLKKDHAAKLSTAKVKTVESNIRRALKNPHYTPYEFGRWRYKVTSSSPMIPLIQTPPVLAESAGPQLSRPPTLPTISTHQYQEEEWREVAPEWFGNASGYQISNKGNLKRNGLYLTPDRSISNEKGFYKCTILNGKTIWWSRLVWKAFVDHRIDVNKITIYYSMFEVDEEGFLDCSLCNLYTKSTSKWLIPQRYLDKCYDPPERLVHPQYGQYYSNVWYPVRAYKFQKGKLVIREYYDYQIIVLNDQDTPYLIYSKKQKGSYISIYAGANFNKDPYVSLRHNNGTDWGLPLTHVILPSFFPEEEPLEHVDHIDDNPLNMQIDNLQYLSRSDNARKGQVKSCLSTRRGIGLIMLCPTGQEFEYVSVAHAARDFRKFTGSKSGDKTIEGKIRNCIYGRMSHYMNFKFRKIPHKVIPGEIWKPYPQDTRILVSNRGRVKNLHGHISRAYTKRLNKYSYLRGKGVHVLVYETFKGIIPRGKMVRHDESAPLTTEGRYRNWAEDLRLGTSRENNQDYFDHRRRMAQKALMVHELSTIKNKPPLEDNVQTAQSMSLVSKEPELESAFIEDTSILAKKVTPTPRAEPSEQKNEPSIISTQTPTQSTESNLSMSSIDHLESTPLDHQSETNVGQICSKCKKKIGAEIQRKGALCQPCIDKVAKKRILAKLTQKYCSGYTNTGNPCKFKATSDSDFCKRHLPMNYSQPTGPVSGKVAHTTSTVSSGAPVSPFTSPVSSGAPVAPFTSPVSSGPPMASFTSPVSSEAPMSPLTSPVSSGAPVMKPSLYSDVTPSSNDSQSLTTAKMPLRILPILPRLNRSNPQQSISSPQTKIPVEVTLKSTQLENQERIYKTRKGTYLPLTEKEIADEHNLSPILDKDIIEKIITRNRNIIHKREQTRLRQARYAARKREELGQEEFNRRNLEAVSKSRAKK